MSRVNGRDPDSYIIEEYISSKDELCFYFSAYKGRLLGIDECIVHNHGEYGINDFKHQDQYKSVSCSTLPAWALIQKGTQQMVAAANFSGIANVDMKWNAQGHPIFFEFNMPRLSLPKSLDHMFDAGILIARIQGYLAAHVDDTGATLEDL